MPFAGFKNFDACLAQMEGSEGYSSESAHKVCGKLKAKLEKSEVSQGTKVEMEHTSDPEKAKKIASDHLKELPDYYERLKVMEKPAFWNMLKAGDLPRAKKKKDEWKTKNPVPMPQYESDTRPAQKCDKAMAAGDCSTAGSSMMHPVADGTPGDMKCKSCRIRKADIDHIDEDESEESEIRQLRLKSKLSPTKRDLKELTVVKDSEREWILDLDVLMKSDREFSGTFHKPVVDKENDLIPASAMDKAMEDFMVFPTLQEVHTERPIGIITRVWKNSEDEYGLEGLVKPGADCDDVWNKIKKGEYDGLSIGGRRIKYSKDCSIPSAIRETPCVTHKLKLYNVSVCSSPVNPEASIDEVNKVAKGGDDLTHPIGE